MPDEAFIFGEMADPKNCLTWRGMFRACGKVGKNGSGLFCSNLYRKRDIFPPCGNVWCGPCYRLAPQDPFPILENKGGDWDEMPFEITTVDEFHLARDGDHMMGTPVECDLCHFQNLARRDPNFESPKDVFQLTCIQRAVLDAFWSRRPSTVALNRRRMWLDYRESLEVFDIVDWVPPFGSDKVVDHVGMGITIITLHASLRPGLYARHLQFQAMRRTPTWFTHLYSSGSHYASESIYAKDEKKLHVSTCPTSGEWFVRLKHGARLRMGEIRRQNEALTACILLVILHEVEEDWTHSPVSSIRGELEKLASALLISFGAALWGVEIMLVSLKGMLSTWLECTIDSPYPFVMVTLHGCFKGETGLRWHCLPLAIYNHSSIPYKLWIG